MMNNKALIALGIAVAVVLSGAFALLEQSEEPLATPESHSNAIAPEIRHLDTESTVTSNTTTALSEPLDATNISAISEPPANISASWFALTLMAFATLVSTSISFYLYRWRKIILANPAFATPERVVQAARLLATQLQTSISATEERTETTYRRISDLFETFVTMRDALDERDTEIRRLKNGYDSELFRRFLIRFVKVDQAIEDFLKSKESSTEALPQIRRLLQDALAESGVETFQPAVGVDYRTADGVAENPRKVVTESATDDLKIAEVHDIGYRLRRSGGFETIMPAKVSVFVTRTMEEP